MFETCAKSIGEALLNNLWQGTALALLAYLLLKLSRRASASARYVVCFATLAAVLALPVLQLVRPAVRWIDQAQAVAPLPARQLASYTNLPAVTVERSTPPIRLQIEVPANSAVSLLVILWMAVASLYCLRLAMAYRGLQRIKSEAGPAPAPYDSWWGSWLLSAPSARDPQFRSSHRIRLPLTAGLREPAIVFPASLLDKLTEPEARAIWLHELAHIRRLDDWTKLAQKFVEALLFFHLAVRWLGRRLECEREVACDDWVVQQTGAPRPYAACLAKLASYASLRSSASPAPAMAADRKQIFWRIKMIINKNQITGKTESRASGILIAVFLLAIAGAMVAAGPIFVLADAQTEEAPPAPPTPASPAIAGVASPAPPPLPSLPGPVAVSPALAAVPPALAASPAPPSPPALAAAPASPAPPSPPALAAAPAPSAPPSPPALAAAPALPVPPIPPQEPTVAPNPDPRPAPNPSAASKPAPRPHPHPEIGAEFHQQMEVMRQHMAEHSEEMQALSRRLREEAHANLEPRREEMQRLARQINETIQTEMRPQIDELREMAHALRKEHMADLPDEARLAELNKKMAALERLIEAESASHVRALEDKMHEVEKQMKPSEEAMKKFEDQMRELELKMREKAEEMRRFERENRQKSTQQNGSGPI